MSKPFFIFKKENLGKPYMCLKHHAIHRPTYQCEKQNQGNIYQFYDFECRSHGFYHNENGPSIKSYLRQKSGEYYRREQWSIYGLIFHDVYEDHI